MSVEFKAELTSGGRQSPTFLVSFVGRRWQHVLILLGGGSGGRLERHKIISASTRQHAAASRLQLSNWLSITTAWRRGGLFMSTPETIFGSQTDDQPLSEEVQDPRTHASAAIPRYQTFFFSYFH